jgi:hypothetical protein
MESGCPAFEVYMALKSGQPANLARPRQGLPSLGRIGPKVGKASALDEKRRLPLLDAAGRFQSFVPLAKLADIHHLVVLDLHESPIVAVALRRDEARSIG